MGECYPDTEGYSQCDKGKKMGDVAAEKESMDRPGLLFALGLRT